jgi:hypothetical protein
MKRATGLMVASILVVLLLPAAGSAQVAPGTIPAPANERPATGFLLQGGLATGATWITGLGGAVAFMNLQGSLRVGAMFDALAITAEISYSSVSDDTSYDGTLLLGPSADIFLWRSSDQTVRLYVLAGVNFGVNMEREDADPPTPAASDDTFASQLVLGVGGMFFLHRNFPIGVEIGSRTTFIGVDNPEYVSGFFAGLNFGLVAGN